MRLLFVCPNLTLGGAERQWSILLPRLASAGFDVRLLTLDGEGPFFAPMVAAGIPTYCARMRRRSDLPGLARAARFALAIRPDVIITRSPSAQIVGHALARATGALHVTTEHRLHDYDRHRQTLTRLIAPRVDRVLGVTEAQRAACSGFGYLPERLHVIENGVSPSQPAAGDREAIRAELGIGPDALVAVLVAALRPEKRIADFVHGVQQAHVRDPRIQGFVIGDGPSRAEVAAVTGEAQGVRMLGYRDDVPRLMNACDVVCLTSVMEALPMVLIEAMALGKPTIATGVGGIPYVVVDGVTGWLVAPGDPQALADRLLELSADRGVGVAAGEAGKARHAERYTSDRMVARHVEFFRSLLPSGLVVEASE